MFASSRFSGFFANGSTVVLVALLVIALFVIILLSGLLCSRCKASSRPMNSAEPQTIEITRFSSDDSGNGKFTGHGDDHTERKKKPFIPRIESCTLAWTNEFPEIHSGV